MKKGFTLLELLIVITLAMLLLLGAVIGIGTCIYNSTHETEQTEEIIGL